MSSDWINKKSHSDKERWICIYPAYINSKKSLGDGRRIPVAKAIENPNAGEIRDVLTASGFTVGLENKAYSREKSNEITMRGRVRVLFRNEDGDPINSKFPNRTSLLLYTAEMIPKLKSRNQPQASAQQATTGGGKKKGKRK